MSEPSLRTPSRRPPRSHCCLLEGETGNAPHALLVRARATQAGCCEGGLPGAEETEVSNAPAGSRRPAVVPVRARTAPPAYGQRIHPRRAQRPRSPPREPTGARSRTRTPATRPVCSATPSTAPPPRPLPRRRTCWACCWSAWGSSPATTGPPWWPGAWHTSYAPRVEAPRRRTSSTPSPPPAWEDKEARQDKESRWDDEPRRDDEPREHADPRKHGEARQDGDNSEGGQNGKRGEEPGEDPPAAVRSPV